MYDLTPFRRRYNDLVDNFFEKDMLSNFFNNDMFFAINGGIRADVRETEKEYIIEAEIPGAKKDEIEVKFRDNYLTISANRNEEINEEKENYIRRERKTGGISRSFYVEDVKDDSIKAAYENGILKVVLPREKSAKSRTHKIDIN